MWRARKEEGVDGKTRREIAKTHLENRKWDLAIPVILEVLEENPEDSVMWHGLGLAYWQKGEKGEAVEPLKAAMRHSSVPHLPAHTLGLLYQDGGRWNYAVVLLEFAASTENFEERERILQDLGRVRGTHPGPAGEDYPQILREHGVPNVDEALIRMARMEAWLGRSKSALKIMEEIRSPNASALCEAASYCMRTKRYAEANEFADRALRADPGLFSARFLKGMVCAQIGSLREAAEHFEKALEIDPSAKNMVAPLLQQVRELAAVTE